MAVMRGGRKMGAGVGAQPIRNMSHPFETYPENRSHPFETSLRAPFETCSQVHLKAIIQSELVFERDIAILNMVWYNLN